MTPSFPTRRSSDLRVGGGEQVGGRHGRFAATRAGFGVFDRITGFFGGVAREQHLRPDRQAQCANAGEQHPASNSIVAIVHALARSEEHTSELQSLMRISYAVFCLKKKKETSN